MRDAALAMPQEGWHCTNGLYHPQDPPPDQLQPEVRGKRLPAHRGTHQMIAKLQHPVATKDILGMLSGVRVISQNLKWKLGTEMDIAFPSAQKNERNLWGSAPPCHEYRQWMQSAEQCWAGPCWASHNQAINYSNLLSLPGSSLMS